MGEKVLFLLLGLLLICPSTLALDCIIANSEDWRDVYSVMLYAGLKNKTSGFLANSEQTNLEMICDEALLISRKNGGFVEDPEVLTNTEDIKTIREVEMKNSNLILLNDLSDVKDFIIVDGSEGYNALSVASYAIETGSWVFISNNYTDKEIERILKTCNVREIIFYGNVNEDLKENLEKYYTETIDNGNKYLDNLEITKRYLKENPSKQVLLTSGNFIERELMYGAHPVLFVGEDMPDEIYDYLQSSDIEVGVLIGNELINSATDIRRSSGISVIVKFAQGARSQTAGVSDIEGLDLFYFGGKMLDYPEEVEESDDEKVNTTTIDSCDGCLLKGSCVAFGYRKNGEYCDLGNEFVSQKDGGRTCDNNFECKGNICASGECVSEGLIKRILSWFGNLFG